MKPVMQTAFHNLSKGTRGNCLWAAISSVTGIPLSTFKDFEYLRNGSWFPPLWDVLDSHGFTYAGTANDIDRILNYKGVDGYYVVGGGSPRFVKEGHAVVFRNGVMAHDPHPSGDGITSIKEAYMIERSG